MLPFKKKSSITIKWTIASSLFIFIMLTIFAVLSYHNAADVILTKEKQNLNLTEKNIQQLLAPNEQLSFQNVISSFAKEKIPIEINPTAKNDLKLNPKSTTEDTYMADISHPYLSIYIYDKNKTIVFKTRQKEVPYKDLKQKNIVTEDGRYLMSSQVIKNKEKIIGYSLLQYEIKNIQEMKQELFKTLAFLELAALVLSGFFGYFLATYFLKPLKNLRDTMEIIRIDPQSKASAVIQPTHDELEDLGNIFNDMLQEIRNYIQQQEQFVQDASHELRTPIAIIKGHLELINRWGKEDPEVLNESIAASLEEITRIQGLVEEMLQLSRSKTIGLTKGKEISVVQNVQNLLNNYRLIHKDYTFKLTTNVQDEIKIYISANHLDQVLIILLDNAIKYAPESRVIDIHIEENEKFVFLEVTDYGKGIAKEHLAKIFHRFYRIDEARSNEISGNGLGLPIAKEIMISYGGNVEVDSHEGKGTTFILQFPKHVESVKKK